MSILKYPVITVFVALFCFIAFPVKSAETKVVRLRTNLGLDSDDVKNSAAKRHVETVKCALNRLQLPFEILQSPIKRNRILTTKNDIDGFFLHAPDSLSDEIAVSTNPLAIERWFLFSNNSSALQKRLLDIPVGTVLGSNEHRWLVELGHQKIVTAPTMDSVVRMLFRKRIEIALAEETHFWRTALNLKLDSQIFKERFIKYAPLVLYFSRNFVQKSPTIVRDFNANIDACVTDLLRPSNTEVRQLLALQKKIMKAEDNYNNILKLLEKMPSKTIDPAQAAKLDEDWKEAVSLNKTTPTIDKILQNDLSRLLQKISQSSADLIAEIFIFDTSGYILALDKPTSDYWQGDEPPYQSVSQNGRVIHVSDIDFDESTEKFQIQISIPIKTEQAAKPIAYMTIGYDVANALAAHIK